MRKKLSVKEKIAETTLDILGEKSINDIRISEITDKAGVARASFYRNFKNFDEVLDFIADQYAINFNEQIIPMLMLNDYNIWFDVIKETLTKIYNTRSHFTDILTANLSIILFKMEEKNMKIPNHEWNSEFVKYEHMSKISSFYTICMAWIKDGAKVDIDELAKFIIEKILLVNK